MYVQPRAEDWIEILLSTNTNNKQYKHKQHKDKQ